MNYLIYFFLLFALSCNNEPRDTGTSSVGTLDDHGMVSSAHPLATKAGIQILRSGGNAFDAAVAIAATLNVVEPAMSGMGGYGTILTYDAKEGKLRFLDSSGKIPMKTDSDLMRPPAEDYLKNRRGAKSVSTPGAVNAWYAMSSEYGILEWKKLFDPAIKLASNGFKADRRLALSVAYSWNDFPEHAREIYGKNGNPLSEGDLLVQSQLANSLKMISEKGVEIFYRGEIARAIDKAMKQSGGFLSINDLEADKAEWWEPVKIDYKGYEVFTASPPSTAFPSLIRLGIFSRYDNKNLEHNSAGYLHLFAEVTKHAFWCRLRYAGDPVIKPPPLDTLLSEKYWNKIAGEINQHKASAFVPPFRSDKDIQRHTTHFVVADKWGNIVSATQTLGNAFGSRIMPQGTGFWLNNSLAYCTYEPKGNPMDAIPGQRKLSGDCPTIILKEGKPWAALGTPGGHTIGQTVPQMVMNLIDYNMSIKDAISAPRISFMEPDYLAVEQEIDEAIIEQLKNKGHDIRLVTGLGNAHGLRILRAPDGKIVGFKGASDPRGNGLAEGY